MCKYANECISEVWVTVLDKKIVHLKLSSLKKKTKGLRGDCSKLVNSCSESYFFNHIFLMSLIFLEQHASRGAVLIHAEEKGCLTYCVALVVPSCTH